MARTQAFGANAALTLLAEGRIRFGGACTATRIDAAA
jgi:hypothetical protein